MENKQERKNSKPRFVIGTVLHALALAAYAAALLFGVVAIATYAAHDAATDMSGQIGTALGAVIYFILFLIAGGAHQLLAYIGIPVLYPCRRAEKPARRLAARILLVTQAITLVLDFALLALILLSFRAG